MRKEYRRICRLIHPDKSSHVQAEAAFKKLAEAYEKLMKRAELPDIADEYHATVLLNERACKRDQFASTNKPLYQKLRKDEELEQLYRQIVFAESRWLWQWETGKAFVEAVRAYDARFQELESIHWQEVGEGKSVAAGSSHTPIAKMSSAFDADGRKQITVQLNRSPPVDGKDMKKVVDDLVSQLGLQGMVSVRHVVIDNKKNGATPSQSQAQDDSAQSDNGKVSEQASSVSKQLMKAMTGAHEEGGPSNTKDGTSSPSSPASPEERKMKRRQMKLLGIYPGGKELNV